MIVGMLIYPRKAQVEKNFIHETSIYGMQLYWVNIPNPNQGTIELPTMKRGGGEILKAEWKCGGKEFQRYIISTTPQSRLDFFAFGRSHRNDFWVINPCGSWAYDPRSGDDYKTSTGPSDWTRKVSWTSMGWFMKLGWLIMNNKAPTITLESNFKDDMEKFHGLRPS